MYGAQPLVPRILTTPCSCLPWPRASECGLPLGFGCFHVGRPAARPCGKVRRMMPAGWSLPRVKTLVRWLSVETPRSRVSRSFPRVGQLSCRRDHLPLGRAPASRLTVKSCLWMQSGMLASRALENMNIFLNFNNSYSISV